MAKEQTFKFPGFYEREIDLSQRVQAPLGTPAGIIGTAERGPAFVPVTVGSFADFKTKFGNLDAKRFGPYAVNEFLKHKTAVTYLRVLGAGANDTTTHIEATRTKGTVVNAGFVAKTQLAAPSEVATGGTVFIAAKHTFSAQQALGYPIFTDNDSYGATDGYMIRGMIMLASGTRAMVMSDQNITADRLLDADSVATLGSAGAMAGKFKLVISSTAPAYSTNDGLTAVRILTASLDPTSNDYISKVLNTNPDKFSTEEHLLYADFAVENEIAPVSSDTGAVALVSGSQAVSTDSGDTTVVFNDLFGRFDTRFTTPTTTWFISQPYGTKEFDLFKFEALSDGQWANDKVKISIADIRKSTDQANAYGTFAVQVRAFDDTDASPQILEQFPNCDLNPSSENYVGKKIGDTKAFYMFDADSEDERRIIVQGRFPNRSTYVRIIMDPAVEKKLTPATALPFGCHGPSVIKTNSSLTDTGALTRLVGSGVSDEPNLLNAILPPLPMTYKVTRGAAATTQPWAGSPGSTEIVDSRLYWGVKTTRVPQTGSLSNAALNPNVSIVVNPLVKSYVKFQGIEKLDALVTGSSADTFNNNKFTLAKVALRNTTVAAITGTASQHMREAIYIRNGNINPNDGHIADPVDATVSRVTLGTLVNLTSSVDFNRFTSFAKFTNLLYGGFDGVNILDQNAARLNDRASSSDTGGGAATSFVSPGLHANMNGVGKFNNGVFSYKTATDIMTDELTVNTNILCIPGMRDSYITDNAATRCKLNGLIFYVQDVVEYDESINRLFDDDATKPDVRKTVEQFEGRAIDNNYAAAYFPDVVIHDADNNKKVQVPASVAVMSALAFNDKVGFPWYAPAGFNRGALDFVSNIDVRLGTLDREKAYDARINPIVHFVQQGTAPVFVIGGQKTLQAAASALDRVNVRRMLLEVKRIVSTITREGFVFEQNTPETRKRWISQITPRLGVIQVQQGIELFRVVMDETNNTQEDAQNNRLNGRIILVPTRTAEFVSMDFIITNAGVSFVE
jgi:hypothetical protein